MERPTVAVLLTRGKIFGSDKDNNLNSSTLFRGKPLFDYPLNALQSSHVERIFTLQEYGQRLEEKASSNSKNTFIECDTLPNDLASSLSYSIMEVFKHYGGSRFKGLNIIFVPCDLPYATASNFNAFIEQGCPQDACCTITFIKRKLLREKYPSRSFWSIYLNDLGDWYAPQSIVTLNCAQLEINQAVDIRHGIILSHKTYEDLSDEIEVIEEIFRTRKRFYNKLYARILALHLFARKKKLLLGISMLSRNYMKQLTIDELTRGIEMEMGIRVHFTSLNETELSIDIDTMKQLKKSEPVA